ncbi:effector-associated constant component EACC1 [Streptomyces lydicus]
MRVRIEVGRDGVAAGADDSAGEAVRSLFTWLSSDPVVACEAGLSLVRRAEEPGPMGPALEAVEAVFDSAVQLASLVVAVAGWRSTRPRGARVHIERAGVRVSVDGGDAEAVARLVRALDSGDAGAVGDAGGAGRAGDADEPRDAGERGPSGRPGDAEGPGDGDRSGPGGGAGGAYRAGGVDGLRRGEGPGGAEGPGRGDGPGGAEEPGRGGGPDRGGGPGGVGGPGVGGGSAGWWG